MAELVLTDAAVLVGQYDLSGVMSSIALDHGAEVHEISAFGDTTKRRIGGLKSTAAQIEGYFDAEAVDAPLFGQIGLGDLPLSAIPQGLTEGNVAYLMQSQAGSYAPGAAIGEVLRFSASAESDGPLVRGNVLLTGTRTVSGNGSGQQLGAVATGQKLYAALHVLAASGTSPTLDVIVESDAESGFASPVTRAMFGQKTAIAAEWATPVDGPVTDDWWRVSWTVAGTSPSFQFVVTVGIQ